jgi:predicted O-linked N-acetylglucosamine transferase (SPINDLY family)
LTKHPKHLDALNLAGVAAYELQQFERARVLLTRVVEREPARAGAQLNLGTCQQRMGAVEDAIVTFRAVLAQHANADTLSELVGSLRRTSRFDEEYACAQQLLALPDAGSAALNAWETLFDACDWDAIERSREHMLSLLEAPSTRASHRTGGLILLHSIVGTDPARTFACHHAWAGSLPSGKKTRQDSSAHPRLRIGYLSPDFRDHSVGLFIRHVIAAHDPANTEVYCYANSTVRDALTEQITAHATRFLDVTALSDEELSHTIADDGIDVLIDLAGHTRDSRVGVLNHRIAPVQITYLGYPDTTGLDTVDFRISDPWTESAEGTRYSEALLEMPESFLCFGAFEEIPTLARSPAAATGVVTFGSFNNIRKLNPQTIAAWSAVLQEVPGSRFVIKSRRAQEPVTQRHLLEQFARCGIAPERIELLAPTAARDDHLAAYNQIDIVLDTFPYHGTTTTCEALWMGVPVVTLAGHTHAERVSYSILRNTGLDELVTWNEPDYIARAIALGTDRAALDALRTAIPEKIRSSILCDPQRFTRQFEALLSDAYEHARGIRLAAATG